MNRIEKNKKISISYIMREWNGEVVEEVPPQEPVEYIHGYNQLIPLLEKSLDNAFVGDTKNVFIRSKDAFGKYSKDLLLQIPKEHILKAHELQVGYEIELNPQNNTVESTSEPTPPLFRDSYSFDDENEEDNDLEDDNFFTVREIFEETVLLDGNHYLAGKDLHFEITVLDVQEASYQEIEDVITNSDTEDLNG